MDSSTDHVQVLPRTYKEDQGYREDDSEPCERSEAVIFQANDSKWHVRATFRGKTGIMKRSGLLTRKELEVLILSIDFRLLPLLPDSVSELVIEKGLHPCDAMLPMKPYRSGTNGLVDGGYIYTVKQYALRVQYPVYRTDARLSTIALWGIEEKEQILNSVFLTTTKQSDNLLIYKTVEHPFYEPSHTTIFEQELRYLQRLESCPHIVQLVAVVTGASPYQTNPYNKGHYVIHGMALEYYPMGRSRMPFNNERAREQPGSPGLAS